VRENAGLVVTTLGTGDDETVHRRRCTGQLQIQLHAALNFPALLGWRSGRVSALGRREIGHGKLLGARVQAVLTLPPPTSPYTIRVRVRDH